MPNDWTPNPPYPFDKPGKVDTAAGRARRQLLKAAAGALIVAAAGYLGWAQLNPAPDSRSRASGGRRGARPAPSSRIALGPVSQIEKTADPTAVMVQGQQAFAEIAGGQPCVLSAVCPHQGCNVEWQSASGKFLCPCHDSEFGRDGSLLQGPSKLPLARIPSVIVNGILYAEA